MGGGSWREEKFKDYSTRTKGCSIRDDGSLDIKTCSASQIFRARTLDAELNPYKAIRECCDSDEHPNTIPVILALDVTGSMGQTAVEVAAELGRLMTELYKSVKDVEFMIMGIGDFAYDDSPLQVSQFESDIRIAEQLDKVYFEFGGGGNSYESYTAAWKFGLENTKLDCWKRNKKGLIITMGDENLNPYIGGSAWATHTGNCTQGDIETFDLYEQAKKKFNIYHINVNHRNWTGLDMDTWIDVLGKDNVITCEVNSVAQTIAEIVKRHAADDSSNNSSISWNNEGISW